MEIVNSKAPEHYTCSIDDFLEVFSHMCLAKYRIKDCYLIPKYVNKSLEVPTTLWYNLNRLQKEKGDNLQVKSILEHVVDHIILHFVYNDELHLSEWVEIWYEQTIKYLEYKIDFNDYLVYITFQTADYADDNYHCHIILFDLLPSEENNILLSAINRRDFK